MERFEIDNATFAVDDNSRTITGLVVPWDAISSPKNGHRYRFARESIKAVAAKFIKFFEDHSPTKRIGRAVSMEETDAGLEMTFKVDRGDNGDKILALAKSGAKTGLSVGVEFDESDTQPDPENENAFLVKLANLYEVSLVERPSFDNSRVITVMASADIGETMDNETTAVEETAETEAPKATQFSIPAGYKLVPEAQATPTVVAPRAASVTVTEPANYTFSEDGSKLQNGKHDFGLDLVAAYNPNYFDMGARQRVDEFMRHAFDVVTSNTNELAPNRNINRYIDKRNFTTPVFDAVNKGTVTQMNGGGITPFQWPVYSSSSGLVAAGTEGTEPSSGTYVTTLGTVTPTTLRGLAKISREMWDAGGIPNVGDVIFGQMVRDYSEALEAAVIATLDAASPTSLGTFTTGTGTNQVTTVNELRKYLAGLNYVRGGFAQGVLFAQIDLYNTLISAADTTGRPIFPAVGPNNADGQTATKWGSININGVTVIPAWGLAATGSVAASSYLIDTTAVDAWADAPTRLNLADYAVSNRFLGVWGYTASVINDIAGVREVIYDPA